MKLAVSGDFIVLFLNRNKPKNRQGKILLVNASLAFEKGTPKNFIPEEHQKRIVDAFLKWKETEKFSKIVTNDEIVRHDYNISPSRFIHTAEEEEYRPLGELFEKLNSLEQEEAEINKHLKVILQKVIS